jgi:hypothetical protein
VSVGTGQRAKSGRGPNRGHDVWTPTDNTRHIDVKVKIRQSILEAVTPAKAVVFDAFAGDGQMWKHVWQHAAGYVGCDERWHNDERCAFVADNKRVLRVLDLAPFTCFDFDAYGSPWDQFGILAARRRLRPGERIGVVLTEGTWFKTRANDPVRGLRGGLPGKLVTPIPYSVHDELIARALRSLVATMGGRIVHHWIAIGTTGALVRYLGVVIDSLKKAGGSDAPSPGG